MAKSHSTRRSGFVYIAQGCFARYKIGKSRNPKQRIQSLQSQEGASVQLLHVIASNDAWWLERKFHHFFSHCHIEGEWYELSDKELKAIFRMRRHDRLRLRPHDNLKPSLDTLQGKSLSGQEAISSAAAALGKKGGKKGGPARAAALSPERRSEIARLGAAATNAKKKAEQQEAG